ncbi:Uncharacterised protein [uncultured archaeon]|nr:Uncharacterised protein [uncultured archaeon]
MAHSEFIMPIPADRKKITSSGPLFFDIRVEFMREDMEKGGFTYMTL